ncbi:MAG: lysophospholipid acyltransferase family protein [Vicinamibacterales bacterium]
MIASALAAVSRLITGAVVEWRSDPHSAAQRIYFANHSSHLDFIVIWSALPPAQRRVTMPVAGGDYWDRGALRRYLAREVFHAVLIERRPTADAPGPSTARASLERMIVALNSGSSLIVFPEGTRSTSGEVGTFKSGLFHLARARPDAELIPVSLENLNRILPKGESLPVPMMSRVIFGPPLRSSPAEDKAAFLAGARVSLLQLRSAS